MSHPKMGKSGARLRLATLNQGLGVRVIEAPCESRHFLSLRQKGKIEGTVHLRVSTDDASLMDLLDRILDKGIAVDLWARVASRGIDLSDRNTRLVMAGPRGEFVFSYEDLDDD